MGVAKKEGEKENGNEQGEVGNVGGKIKFKRAGVAGSFQTWSQTCEFQIIQIPVQTDDTHRLQP